MAGTEALKPEVITQRLTELPGWRYQAAEHKIIKEFTFKSYLAGVNFVNVVAAIAEAMNHHPDIALGYQKVSLSFTTHDAGHRVSEKDLKSAACIEALPLFKKTSF